MSDYRIAITRADGRRVTLLPGAKGERDLVDAIVARLDFLKAERIADNVAAYGVGVFRTEARVRSALTAVLGDTKAEARHVIEGVLKDLKSEVVPTR